MPTPLRDKPIPSTRGSDRYHPILSDLGWERRCSLLLVSRMYDSRMMVDTQPLSEEDHDLIEFARQIVDENTDGAVHTVGAAVRDVDGRMHGGINLYHFTGGPCAELVALATARANGARKLVTIVAVGDNGRGVVGPCGRDRQILFDYYPDVKVLVPTPEGVRSVDVASLLPLPTPWSPDVDASEDTLSDE